MVRRVWAALVVTSIGMVVGVVGQVSVGLGSGGPLVGLLTLDFFPLNAALSAAGYPTVEGPLVVFGGGGVGGVLGGPVFGGIGFGGNLTALAADKRTDLELGYGGVVIEAARPAGQGAIIGVGAVLGGGGLDLTARARRPLDFDDALADPPVSQFRLGFFGGLAYLRLQVQVLPWLAVEGWGGYFLAFPGRWEEGGREIAGPQLELRAPFLGLRISFGGIGSREAAVPEPEPPASQQEEQQ